MSSLTLKTGNKPPSQLTGAMIADMFIASYQLIDKHIELVNGLNVFPVPDGDTGTNMCFTLLPIVEYPYDNKWEVIHSKESWSEKHCHTLITKRLNKTGNIIEEIKKIKEISKSKKYKFDKYLIKRFLPNKIFNILLMIKNKFFKL